MDSCNFVLEHIRWYDWASVAILYALGAWKLFELVCKLGEWVAFKIRNTPRSTSDE